MYIFAYGSLINLKSANKAVGHTLKHLDLIPVTLLGYRRTWDLIETVHSIELDSNISAAFLNLTKSSGMYVNGVLIPINDAELDLIANREKNYEMVDISESICCRNLSLGETLQSKNVYTVIAKDEFQINNYQNNDVFFLEEYNNLVMEGVTSFGDYFLEQYIQTTETSNLEIVKGSYKFIDQLQNSLT